MIYGESIFTYQLINQDVQKFLAYYLWCIFFYSMSSYFCYTLSNSHFKWRRGLLLLLLNSFPTQFYLAKNCKSTMKIRSCSNFNLLHKILVPYCRKWDRHTQNSVTATWEKEGYRDLQHTSVWTNFQSVKMKLRHEADIINISRTLIWKKWVTRKNKYLMQDLTTDTEIEIPIALFDFRF